MQVVGNSSYQMLGYVYGEHYKQYVKSVRCLNRAYRLGQDHAVLESLGCAYHLLAIHDALRADNTIEIEKVDRSSLYKARECFLILLDKADELYLQAMMKREGGIIYDTFFFEQDNYRILTLYPTLIKNSPNDVKIKRDFEMKYAKIVYVTHFSVSRMLEEITHFKNENMEVILAYLESAEHVKLQSPNFEVQLKVRENVNYYEPCSTIAMAVEAEIPAIIGETMLAQNLIDRFKNYIVRPDELEEMMGIACNSCFVREYQNNKG